MVVAYYALIFASIFAVLSDYLPEFIRIAALPVLWLCTRPTFPLKPKLPEKEFTGVESQVWFGGGAVAAVMTGGSVYLIGNHDALKLFQAVAIGVAAWACVFLAFRDCHRILHDA